MNFISKQSWFMFACGQLLRGHIYSPPSPAWKGREMTGSRQGQGRHWREVKVDKKEFKTDINWGQLEVNKVYKVLLALLDSYQTKKTTKIYQNLPKPNTNQLEPAKRNKSNQIQPKGNKNSTDNNSHQLKVHADFKKVLTNLAMLSFYFVLQIHVNTC